MGQSSLILASMRAVGSGESEPWGKIGVVDPGALERSQSIAGWGKLRVADPGIVCLEPPSHVGP